MMLTKEQIEQSFMPQDIALEIIGFLEMARCGKPGMPNTIWAMTKEIIERAEKAEAEVTKLKAYVEQEKFNWLLDRERAAGAEAELAELREAVAWCRECDELYEYDRKHGIATGGGYLEFWEIVKCAEQELCRLSEGEDG